MAHTGSVSVGESWMWFRAMFTLAGKTATYRATSPQAAERRVFGTRTPIPPSTSKNPLTSTRTCGHGSQVGTMRSNGSGLTKCVTPTAIIATERMPRAVRRIGDMLTGGRRARVGGACSGGGYRTGQVLGYLTGAVSPTSIAP